MTSREACKDNQTKVFEGTSTEGTMNASAKNEVGVARTRSPARMMKGTGSRGRNKAGLRMRPMSDFTAGVKRRPNTRRHGKSGSCKETVPQAEAKSATSASDTFDVFAMEIPRRPRSKRSTTVVKFNNFSFRDLPSLLNGNTQQDKEEGAGDEELAARKTPAVEESPREKTFRKAPRKPKSGAAPQRIVTAESTQDESERRPRRRRKTLDVSQLGLLPTESAETDDASFAANEQEPAAKGPKTSRRGRGSRGRSGRRIGKEDGRQVRSLRDVIEECMNQSKETKKPESVTCVEVSVKEQPRVTKPPPPPRTRDRVVKSTIDNCPTITVLLKRGSIQIGDYVELVPVDSDLKIHGWVTPQGILCSHCAMVHSCKLFGACADCNGANSRLRIKDGRSFAQLMH